MAEMGLILVKSNADLDREEHERLQSEQDAQKEQVESSLAAHIRRVWEEAKRAKEPVETRMLSSLRRINGKYAPDKEAEISAQGMPLIYMKIVSVKCRAAKGWIRDILLPAGDKPWTLKASPVPSLPPELARRVMERVTYDANQFVQVTGQQLTPDVVASVTERFAALLKKQMDKQADLRVSRMETLIEDQLIEGGWHSQFDECISDLIDYPAAILKGPVIRFKKRLSWDGGSASTTMEAIPEVERVDPFSFYPAPGVVEPEDGDCIEVHDYSKDDLVALKGLPGYDDQAISDALNDFGSLKDWSRQSLESSKAQARGDTSGTEWCTGTIEALEYWGSVQGKLLREWGVPEEECPDTDEMYQVMAVLIGRHVIAVRINADPLGRKPYSKACFENIPGSFWGNGVPDMIGDCEDVCNASARSMVANMGIASGPQVSLNTGSLPPGEDVTNVFPWKIWQLDYTKTGANSRPPIEFWQPNPMTAALMDVFKFFSMQADEYSGIPSYVYGGNSHVTGAAKTASGLSMLMNSASKGIKNVVNHVDRGIITSTVERFYDLNMLYSSDQSIKGDAQVVARGAMSLVMKEQNQMRVQELLQQTANPLDMQILGIDGRAALLRRAVQGVDVGGDEVVPSDEELHQKEIAAQRMAQQQQSPAQLNAAGQPMGRQ